MKLQKLKTFDAQEHLTWTKLFGGLDRSRRFQAHPLFNQGIDALGIDDRGVPDLVDVNKRLKALTGWEGVAVEGLEENPTFFAGLADRKFPIGNFIRDAADINYTPAPDIFHDLYGHLPLLADPEYADFCFRMGQAAKPYLNQPDLLEQFGRLFWFGVEFPLVRLGGEKRIFGGGILSSVGECDYCLGSEVDVVPFDVEEIRRRQYHIDDYQVKIYRLDRPEQLYKCLEEFVDGVRPLAASDELKPIRRISENLGAQL